MEFLPAQQPASTAGPVTYGPGQRLCSDWSTAEAKAGPSEHAGNRFFVAGTLSAYTIYVSPAGFDVAHSLTPDDMKGVMHTECAAHPTETIATVATALIASAKSFQAR